MHDSTTSDDASFFTCSGSSPGRSGSRSALARTLAVRGGRTPDPGSGALVAPICQSTTFAQHALGEHRGFTYSRCDNPTVRALEEALAAVEGTRPEHALAFATGMAALAGLVLTTCARGERVVLSKVVYGGTVRLVREVLAPFGLEPCFCDTTDLAQLARALERPRDHSWMCGRWGSPFRN
ncbi:MAG: PLP-dependent transferase [Planctomycetota bacterium]